MSEHADKRKGNWLIAAALAWLVPGAGHVYLRRPVRGAILFVTIGATFWAGVAMGGVMTVDHRYEPWWFAAEMFTGVHGLYSWRQTREVYSEIGTVSVPRVRGTDGELAERVAVDAELNAGGRNLALVAPTATVARAYAGVAGMLNLMCIFDAAVLSVMGVRGEPPPRRKKNEDA